MKKTKVIIPALGILLLSTAASVTGTVAWFSSNASVSATGMSVKAHTDEALVIDSDHEVGAAITVDLSSFNEDVALVPITFDSNAYKYCTNGAIVDPNTGYALAGEDITLTACPGATSGTGNNRIDYYKEFVVYLAAAGQAITGGKLNATVSFGAATYTQKAATIDFSVLGEASQDIDPAEQSFSHSKTVNASMTGDDLTISLSTSQNFPLNTSNKSIPVLMRLYIDGALADADNAGKAYVRSQSVNLTALTVSVTFSLGQ